MFAYDFDRLNNFFKDVLQRNLTTDAMNWLLSEGQSVREKNAIAKFNIAFVAMPRKTGKGLVKISTDDQTALNSIRKGFRIRGWTAERLSRVWLLMQLEPTDKEKYISVIGNLFLNAEMSELVALYSSLSVLAHPESWRNRCAEGIRSNIGQVLEAVVCDNPYPSEQLDEAAWNQLVLKAIFTGKPMLRIVRLRERANLTLANSLTDYAHERWAAYRDINPLLWICVGPFIDSDNFSDIQRVLQSENPLERDAGALACYESAFPPARKIVEENAELKHGIASGKISWSAIAERMGEGM